MSWATCRWLWPTQRPTSRRQGAPLRGQRTRGCHRRGLLGSEGKGGRADRRARRPGPRHRRCSRALGVSPEAGVHTAPARHPRAHARAGRRVIGRDRSRRGRAPPLDERFQVLAPRLIRRGVRQVKQTTQGQDEAQLKAPPSTSSQDERSPQRPEMFTPCLWLDCAAVDSGPCLISTSSAAESSEA